MPGYDRTRFVGISEEDLKEYICGICLQVFNKPTFTECCGQTYCYECINEWVSQNNSCPFDRKGLTQDQLKSAPKLLIDLLGDMKIKCEYQKEGCNSIIKANDLDRHNENECLFNPLRSCDKCGLTKLNHTDKICIDQLSVKLKETSDELETLQMNYEIMIKEKNVTQKANDSNNSEILEKIKSLENKINILEEKFNSEILKSLQLQNLNNNTQGLVWVKCSNGEIPIKSVIGGKDYEGNLIYVGRSMHNGNCIPGMILHRICYNVYKGRILSSKEYEVLTNTNNCNLEWIAYYGQLLSGAIEGGYEDGNPKLLIGRTTHFGSVLVGKIVVENSFAKTLYFPCKGKEVKFTKFEILVSKENN